MREIASLGSLMTGDYALYRYFDAADRLLYIGKSGDLAVRGKSHIRSSEWMKFAVRSSIERCLTSEELGKAERKAIEAEGPIFNRQYNDTPEAKARLRAYLEEVGRLDLMPVYVRPVAGAGRTAMAEALASGAAGEDTLNVLWKILTADSPDHGEARLWAMAALEGYGELPRGTELKRLAALVRVNPSTAYRAKKAAAQQAVRRPKTGTREEQGR